MGVEYTHYLLPRDATYRPSAERLSRFAAALIAEGWLFAPGTPAFARLVSGFEYEKGGAYAAARKTGATYADMRGGKGAAPAALGAAWLRARKPAVIVSWPIDALDAVGARQPLVNGARGGPGVSFTFVVRWSHPLLGITSESFCSPSRLACVCGAPLTKRGSFPFITTHAARCPTCGTPVDKGAGTIHGSGLHRFAIGIECGKKVPDDPDEAKIAPELMTLVRDHFHCDLFQLGVIH